MTQTTTSGLSLNHELLCAVPRHIPCPDTGKVFKTELVLVRADEPILNNSAVGMLLRGLAGRMDVADLLYMAAGVTAIKVNWWHGPDPRGNPHNHPWGFKSLILSGGYVETRYLNREGDFDTLVHHQGDIVNVPADHFHTVDAVEPGTVSLMVCGPFDKKSKEWGHRVNGEYVKASTPPKFMQYLREANSFMPDTRGN